MKRLVYIMDPHCGWCYGNSDNIVYLSEKFRDHITFELMPGGMWLESSAPHGGKSLEQFINAHTPRMEALTGAYVSKAYYKLTGDNSYVFSSLEPSAAIVLIKKMTPDAAIPFSKAVQRAIFVDGMRLDKLETYLPILNEVGINPDTFAKNWMSELNLLNTQEEFNAARKFANSFPTFLFQDDSNIYKLASGYFDKEEMAGLVSKIVSQRS